VRVVIWRGWRRTDTGVAALTPRQLGERGLEHFSAGRLTSAEHDFRQAWRLDPGYAEMPYNLALLADARGEPDAAVEWLREAIALRPGFAEAHFNLATVLAELDDPASAVGAYHQAESLGADSQSARTGRGWAHFELEEFDAALECFDSVLAQTPGHAEARLGRSFVWLKRGRYAEGFADFESRFDTHDIKATRLAPPGPSWRGEDVSGKTVAVVAEQGLGDTLQFARYAPLLADRGARVALLVQPSLGTLAATLPGVEVFALGETPPPYHYHVSLLSLPHLLGPSDRVPAAVPYFQSDPVRAAQWRNRLSALPGLRVGLVWAGDAHPQHPRGYRPDRRRSVPLRQFAPLARVPGVSFVSLQKNARAAEAHSPDAPFAIADWTGELADFADTAALVAELDLVISVDTAVAHLAGALARPVWVLSRHGGCWRWLAGQEHSPWYPTARVFHQPARWDWDTALARVADALDNFVAQRTAHPGTQHA
jgi:tetratricopeptide (TPR) repeat protein